MIARLDECELLFRSVILVAGFMTVVHRVMWLQVIEELLGSLQRDWKCVLEVSGRRCCVRSDLLVPERARDWSGPRQEGVVGGRLQPLQANLPQPSSLGHFITNSDACQPLSCRSRRQKHGRCLQTVFVTRAGPRSKRWQVIWYYTEYLAWTKKLIDGQFNWLHGTVTEKMTSKELKAKTDAIWVVVCEADDMNETASSIFRATALTVT